MASCGFRFYSLSFLPPLHCFVSFSTSEFDLVKLSKSKKINSIMGIELELPFIWKLCGTTDFKFGQEITVKRFEFRSICRVNIIIPTISLTLQTEVHRDLILLNCQSSNPLLPLFSFPRIVKTWHICLVWIGISGACDLKCLYFFVCVETGPFPQHRRVTYTWSYSDEHWRWARRHSGVKSAGSHVGRIAFSSSIKNFTHNNTVISCYLQLLVHCCCG